MATYGIPEHIRSDNGTEFIAQKIDARMRDNRIETPYTDDPGIPWQNGYKRAFKVVFATNALIGNGS